MTEAEWSACAEPELMLKFLAEWLSERRLRLFGCGCVERIRPLLTDAHSIAAILATEQFIEGLLSAEDLEVASYAAHLAAEEIHSSGYETERVESLSQGLLTPTDETFGIWEYASLVSAPARAASYISYPSDENLPWAVEQVVSCVTATAGHAAERMFADTFNSERRETVVRGERASLALLLRDIVGNPFQNIALDPRWQTETVLALAAGIYAQKAFDRMPILADSLQDAGCDNSGILNHCRGEGTHARGCWVVDLLLGKS